jgi:hypothetical protein
VTPRAIELDLSRVMDAGFEVVGELAGGRRDLDVALRLDDQEQTFRQQLLAEIQLLPPAFQRPLLAKYLPADALDLAQRAATEAAGARLAQAAEFQRQGNGFLERAMDGLRDLFATGKWKGRAS